MSNDLYKHYDPALTASGQIEFQWTMFDPLITDEQLADLIAPAELESIKRKDSGSTVSYYSTSAHAYDVLKRIREFESSAIKSTREDLRQKTATESASRFYNYIATLMFVGCEGFEKIR